MELNNLLDGQGEVALFGIMVFVESREPPLSIPRTSADLSSGAAGREHDKAGGHGGRTVRGGRRVEVQS